MKNHRKKHIKLTLLVFAWILAISAYAQNEHKVSSGTSGDAFVTIEADTDNSNEGDNAYMQFRQDGGLVAAYIGFNQDWGGTVEPDNFFRIGSRRSGVDYFNRLVINTANGNIGFGTNNPLQKLDIIGGNIGLESNYGFGRFSDGNLNVFKPFRTGFKSLSGAANSPYDNAMTLEGDGLLAFVETDNDAVKGWMDLNSAEFYWSGWTGFGTYDPKGKVHISSAATNQGSTNNFDAGLLVQATASSRLTTQGAALGFVVPANTDGGNPWQQGRILVTPDNANNGRAEGRMYLQTRYLTGGAWHWRENIVLRSSGNVGIGTDSPDMKLTVQGDVNVGGTGNGKVKVRHVDGKSHTSSSYGTLYLNYSSTYPVVVGTSANETDLFVYGGLRLGTEPIPSGYKLAIDGKAIMEEVKVEVSPWPDYVFTPSYDLQSLEEVETFINENGHLPNIPSAAEVEEENGIELGEMNAKLLEKIEELTLYVIDLDKRDKEKDQLIEELKEELQNLKTNHINEN